MPQQVIVISHRRSGTHLTIDTIVNNFQLYGENPPISTLTLDHLSEHVAQKKTSLDVLSETLAQKPCVLKSHAHSELSHFFIGDSALHEFIEDLFASSKVIYVYRDGRDVLVSLYYYNQLFDKSIRNMSFHQFIRMPNTFDNQTYPGDMNRASYWQYHVASWLSRPNLLYLSFQDILQQYETTIHRIADFIHQPVAAIKDVRRTKSKKETPLGKLISRFGGRSRQSPKYSSVGFRKGKSGDWRDHFSEDDLAFFEQQAGEINSKLAGMGTGAS